MATSASHGPTLSAATRPLSGWVRIRRWGELGVLFGAVPAAFLWVDLRRAVLPTILAFAGMGVLWLFLDPAFERARFWRLRGVGSALKRALPLTLVGLALGVPLVAWLMPDQFLSFPRHRPRVWLLVMCLYPVLSAYPQEIIYRAFFHHRYGLLFGSQRSRLIASALAFGAGHTILRDVWAIALAAFAGFVFAQSYERTRSVVAAAALHALYGCLAFTLGLGGIFYKGGRAPSHEAPHSEQVEPQRQPQTNVHTESQIDSSNTGPQKPTPPPLKVSVRAHATGS